MVRKAHFSPSITETTKPKAVAVGETTLDVFTTAHLLPVDGCILLHSLRG